MATDARRTTLAEAMSSVERFSRAVLGRPLRAYQLEVARAIHASVRSRKGLTIAVMMARQAGKNETSAHVEALLLNAYRRLGGFIVKAAPTFRPQAITSLIRLQSLLEDSPLGRRLGGLPGYEAPEREEGYILRLGRARAAFMSGGPGASVVGATANILLEGDEAQDLDADVWNRAFRPMAASTNATTVLWGTAWTSRTLLATSIRKLRDLEARDGLRRVFVVPWERVAGEVPAYGAYVRGEIARLGRDHPLIRTQYCLEEIDAESGMFPPAVQRLMQGTHERRRDPAPNAAYALLVDVGGGAEDASLALSSSLPDVGMHCDATALTVVETSWPINATLPHYRVVDRVVWTGAQQDILHGAIARLADIWGARRVIVDATGLGAPLAQALQRTLGGRVRPYVFTAATKSALGWGFLGLCQAGRWQDYAEDGGPERAQFWREVAAARYEVVDGPSRLMRWGVPDPAVHDDLLVSASLTAALDEESAAASQPAVVIEAGDVLG
jgi:hypothetical protein